MYWTNDVLARIVIETNWYARAPLPHERGIPQTVDNSQTKGGVKWIDVTLTELRTWLWMCILRTAFHIEPKPTCVTSYQQH